MSGTRADARKAREEFVAGVDPTWYGEKQRAQEVEDQREALQHALSAVWSGADFTDADCVLDHLGDLGYRVVEQ